MNYLHYFFTVSFSLIVVSYSNLELADMHYVYGLADDNGENTKRIYHQRYPNRGLPDSRTFSNFPRLLMETGTVRKRLFEGKPP